jgi:hypothetical protein
MSAFFCILKIHIEQMNNLIFGIISLFLLFSCRTKESIPGEIPSIIHSEDLKLELGKISEEFFEEYSKNKYPEFSILVTEKYLYIAINQLSNCPPISPYYEFKEKFANLDIWFTIPGDSHQPERFFKMDDLVLNKEISNMLNLCHPDGFHYRYKIEPNNRLKLEKRVKINEGSPEEDLLVNEDDKYKIEIIEEPEKHN